MKLRIRGNSVRLRVTRGELDTIVSTGVVEEHVDFATSTLRYALLRDPQAEVPSAHFNGQSVEVRLPAATVDAWARDESQVSIDAEQGTSGDGALRILVEKDFACLQPRTGEDESDMFAHPDTGNHTC